MAGVAEQRDSDRLALQPDSRGAAVWTALGGGIASIACGGAAIWLVRDQLHISCGVGQPGSEGDGTWMCADGISYLWVAVVLGAMLAFGVLAGALTAGLVRPARAACLILVLLAAAMTVWILGWTWHASSELVWAVPPDTLSVDYWYAAVLPAAIASAAAFLPALVGIFTQRCRRPRSFRRGCRGTPRRHGTPARSLREHPRGGRTPRGRCSSCSRATTGSRTTTERWALNADGPAHGRPLTDLARIDKSAACATQLDRTRADSNRCRTLGCQSGSLRLQRSCLHSTI